MAKKRSSTKKSNPNKPRRDDYLPDPGVNKPDPGVYKPDPCVYEPDPKRPPLRIPVGPARPPRPRPADYTPFLVIRYIVGDEGDRPIPPGIPALIALGSPDVWIVNSAGVVNAFPVPGTPHQLFAVVHNFGRSDATTVVRFWETNGFSMSEKRLVGATTVWVASESIAVAQCPTPWIPENNLAILAGASALLFDPIALPPDPWVDRHVGMRGVFHQAMTAGQEFSFEFGFGNTSPITQEVTLTAETRSGDEIRQGAGISLPGFDSDVSVTAENRVQMELYIGQSQRFVTDPDLTFARRLHELCKANDQLPLTQTSRAVSRSVNLQPWEVRTLTIAGRIPRSAEPGEILAFDVTQRNGPIPMGGYGLLIEVTE